MNMNFNYYTLLFVLISAPYINSAKFTCLTDGVKKETSCAADSCFLLYNKYKGVREYGCIIKITQSQRKYCFRHPELCFTCDTKNCNSMKLMKLCRECLTNGQGGDERCTTDPAALGNRSVTLCYTDCAAYRVFDGSNVRGCFPEGSVCTPGSCIRCSEDMCNDVKVPEFRRICNTNSTTSEICSEVDDACMCVLNSAGKPVTCGCKQRLLKDDKIQNFCQKQAQRCHECTTNNCNHNDLQKKEVFKICDQEDDICEVDP
ncbi:uncharacterized protein LOC113377655 [Ctenocephalides felis]|uniref:uncharacterized protein LOC113377655 n=1 Tax=Ctenocephalides felis TaxID=7515 RepID=UPI000E6E4B6D|nr:uncharacterized protein LOC113377655 [Ctenocephalides felis]